MLHHRERQNLLGADRCILNTTLTQRENRLRIRRASTRRLSFVILIETLDSYILQPYNKVVFYQSRKHYACNKGGLPLWVSR